MKIQRLRQMSGQPTAGFFGDLLGGVVDIATSLIPGPIDDGIIGIGRRIFSGNKPGADASCPPGFRVDPNTGRCLQEGFGGIARRFLPGGDTGMLPQSGPTGTGMTVMGSFGVPAMQPTQMVTQRLDCPPGFLLGMDNLCYAKGTLPRQFRKWKPARKPPISAKDWRSVQVASRVEKKIKRIAATAGFTCRTKGSSRRKS